jgi:hypothetical protein
MASFAKWVYDDTSIIYGARGYLTRNGIDTEIAPCAPISKSKWSSFHYPDLGWPGQILSAWDPHKGRYAITGQALNTLTLTDLYTGSSVNAMAGVTVTASRTRYFLDSTSGAMIIAYEDGEGHQMAGLKLSFSSATVHGASVSGITEGEDNTFAPITMIGNTGYICGLWSNYAIPIPTVWIGYWKITIVGGKLSTELGDSWLVSLFSGGGCSYAVGAVKGSPGVWTTSMSGSEQNTIYYDGVKFGATRQTSTQNFGFSHDHSVLFDGSYSPPNFMYVNGTKIACGKDISIASNGLTAKAGNCYIGTLSSLNKEVAGDYVNNHYKGAIVKSGADLSIYNTNGTLADTIPTSGLPTQTSQTAAGAFSSSECPWNAKWSVVGDTRNGGYSSTIWMVARTNGSHLYCPYNNSAGNIALPTKGRRD